MYTCTCIRVRVLIYIHMPPCASTYFRRLLQEQRGGSDTNDSSSESLDGKEEQTKKKNMIVYPQVRGHEFVYGDLHVCTQGCAYIFEAIQEIDSHVA